jgi:hypothetical protein
MAIIIAEDFVSPNGTTLSAHNSDWVQHPFFSGNSHGVITNNRLRASTAASEFGAPGAVYWWNPFTPAADDHRITGTFHVVSTALAHTSGLVVRLNETAMTAYRVWTFVDVGDISVRLSRVVAGASTTLATVNRGVATVGAQHTFTLEAVADGVNVRVQVRDGSNTLIIDHLDSTASKITALGRVGVEVGGTELLGRHIEGATIYSDSAGPVPGQVVGATAVVSNPGGYQRNTDSATTEAAILDALSAADATYVRSPLNYDGAAALVVRLASVQSADGRFLRYEYGKETDNARRVDQLVELRSPDMQTILRAWQHNDVAVRPIAVAQDISDLSVSGEHLVYFWDTVV